MSDEVFPFAPLDEVVFQVRFPGELVVESNKHLFQQAIRDDLPILQLAASKEPTHPSLLPSRFESQDRLELFQLSINSASYHSLKYPGFESFRERCSRFFGIFGDIFKIERLRQTGLRYVNHLPVLREKGLVPLQKYLRFGYVLPPTIPVQLEDFSTTLTTKVGAGRLKTIIELSTVKGGAETLLLDFDFTMHEGELKFSALDKYLAESHAQTKNIFMSLITDDYLKVMRSGGN